MTVTALVLARQPYARRFDGVDEVVVLQGRVFRSAADHQAAWNEAVLKVRTEHFFFLDDDDDLPADGADVIRDCLAADADLAYTDELLTFVDGTTELRRGEPYSQEAHLVRPMLVHHLAVCRTRAAVAALSALPVGHFWPEMLLYWQMAKAGAAYVPRVGYVWHVAAEGLHTQPFAAMGQVRSQLWCKANP